MDDSYLTPVAGTMAVSAKNHLLKQRLNKHRSAENSLTLAEAVQARQTQDRSDAFADSAQGLLRSGAMKGSAAKAEEALRLSRQRRIAASMQIDSVTVAGTKGWRMRSAYRMVSYMARICGGLQNTMMLSDLFHDRFGADPSLAPFQPPDSTDVYGAQYIVEALSGLDHLPYTYGDAGSGMTYLPPPIPDQFYGVPDPTALKGLRQTGTIPANYNPEEDEPLGVWLDAYSHLSNQLHIHDGTVEEPEAGVFGTVGMFNPNSARLLWPLRDELLLYEQELMLAIFDKLCTYSVQKVEGIIMEELGYGRPEAVMLVKTGLRYGTGVYESDIDMAKVRELKSLEIISDKARDGEDPRAQIAARKQFQLVAGLTKDSSSDQAEQFRELARRTLEDDDVLEIGD